MWLFNECGVFSLAQGQTFDANALFGQSLKLQEAIDGGERGPMRQRILVNWGLCLIDRGRLVSARRTFREIQSASENDPLLQTLAAGFLAHIDSLTGQIPNAERGFAETAVELEKQRHLRPLAILYCSWGDLHRHIGKAELAIADYKRAHDYAEAAGYADFVHYARIGIARTRLWRTRSSTEIEESMRILEAAEEYADRMDIPRLKCEVMVIRGEIQIGQGEMVLASQLVTRAIRIANLNGLVLRKISALQLLSEIHRARGDMAGADRLYNQTLQAAREIGYHLTVTHSSLDLTVADTDFNG